MYAESVVTRNLGIESTDYKTNSEKIWNYADENFINIDAIWVGCKLWPFTKIVWGESTRTQGKSIT